MSSPMDKQMRVAVVLLAAGTGSRFGHSTNKVWLELDGAAVISRSLKNAVESFNDPRTILVINPLDKEIAIELLDKEVPELEIEFVDGGKTRHESEYNALEYLASAIKEGSVNVVVIHDGARPLASSELFHTVASTAHEHGGALPAIAVDQREIDIRTERKLVRVQTPQAFRGKEVLDAYLQAKRDDFVGTDTAACMERYYPQTKSVAVKGEASNIKITYAEDLHIAQTLLLG
ncbi:MAG: NTP transferase domain-containing protein [Actinobacteria bacterium]|uniref:Unannotated protein n=1 Tax=freshwater metagenome TaxID=449393 RepID=A0A6J6LUJ9_9ZZZZ|nr:NTP transferase domain-containing protein [Actinomycetota bacterium]MSX25161.1 NTP transferase domain-containing protein [Actinomycetota bacterium]MSY46583.1 NTP transferase domain-containing protein [Actinomycetota bacterium]MSY57537.1 NTP transferase domain-containing protein [Actinomycetota bacterium]MTB00837.1 NTP transferase domain-containing protein [Actinomycetota bacterium]